MKGGRLRFGRRAAGGEAGSLSPDYYLTYLRALQRVFKKQVPK